MATSRPPERNTSDPAPMPSPLLPTPASPRSDATTHTTPAPARRDFSHKLFRTMTLLGAIYACLQLFYFFPLNWNRDDDKRDVVIYHQAARAARHGQALYINRPHYGPDGKPFDYLYPPPFAAILAPLGNLTFLQFARLWSVLLIVAFWLYAWSLAHLSRPPSGSTTSDIAARTLIAGLILGFWPGTQNALSLGQADPLLWALFGLALSGVPREKDGTISPRAPLLLSIGTLIKIYSCWPLALLLRRDWRRLLPVTLVCGLAGLALGAAVCGADSYRQWASAVLPVAGQGTFNSDNFSLSMGVLRIARVLGWHYTGGPLTGLPKWWLTLGSFLGPLGTWWWLRRHSLLLQVATVGCTAALFAPLCWTTYLPLLFVPLTIYGVQRMKRPSI